MLRSFALVLLVSGFALATLAQTPLTKPSLPERIKAQRWQKRVVVLCAPTAESAELKQQKASMAAAQTQVNARDMLILEAIETSLSPSEKQYVRQTLGIKPGGFALVLIGKDGGVKRKETEPIDPKALFETIDAMPMRRQEMREKDR
ncbi:hypothetical protein GCM10011375_02140 [Hymenobacter qilianensis]|uniref:Uncharacterized protein n=2 Tax=Hymenobacter qilianensis TaxID=1385715 RepID=A0ACB5PLJ4_9BACT|nr:DUF4174 domain-containing protein [Hymenobacter qilianensis]QNP50847.1 DUF4174 domain-containing protein [Hymenobacter qilianensis]GGF50223.1 hypothetical protein GCM10011375_02140 [Hymenobacter qilianensis]